MRRMDREIKSGQEIDEVLHNALVCHLAMLADGEPYLVPVSFGYDGSCIYFHGAGAGKKADCLQANPRVCFQVERNVRVRPSDGDACGWSCDFESVIGFGEACELTSAEEKRQGLNQIMLHYSGREWALDSGVLDRTRVWRIAIDRLTGKRSPGIGEA